MHMKKVKNFLLVCGVLLTAQFAGAQATFPENGVVDPRHGYYAFTNATIVKDGKLTKRYDYMYDYAYKGLKVKA